MRDTTAQTRFESISKLSNDSLLVREKTKTTQSNEIDSLKRRVKKLKKRNRSRTHKVKRLYKVGLTARVESSDEESLEMFDMDHEVVSTAATTVTTEELTTSKTKVRGNVIEEQEEPGYIICTTLGEKKKTLCSKKSKREKEQTTNTSSKEKIMCNYLKNMEGYKLKQLKLKEFDEIQEIFDKAFRWVNTFEDFRSELVEGKEKRAGEEVIQESTKKQKVEDDKEITELKQSMEIIPDKEEVEIDAFPLAIKSPRIIDWKIYKEGKKNYYQIIRADRKTQMYMVFSKMLESFDREDLVALYNLVKAKFKSTRPMEDLDLLLWGDLKTMFEP
nr:hypothetical protein [Tanacetum cinerariifolium]